MKGEWLIANARQETFDRRKRPIDITYDVDPFSMSWRERDQIQSKCYSWTAMVWNGMEYKPTT
jgi:hypothetical protein